MIRTLNLSFDEKQFRDLKEAKETHETMKNKRISWEDFVFQCVCGK